MEDNINKGAIAYCNHNILGLITKDAPTSQGVWKGIKLEEGSEGKPWQSKHPRVVGHINNFKNKA